MNAEQDTIRQLAYALWEKRGRPEGSAEEDWLAAEQRLASMQSKVVDESVQESFPASDPPASGLPDEPPVNAEEKWAAAAASRPAAAKRRSAGKGPARAKGLRADPG